METTLKTEPPTVCWICESTDADYLHDLTVESNAHQVKKLAELMKIEIHRDDLAPRCLCDECLEKLNSAYDFVQKCIEAERRVQSRVVEHQLTIKKEEDYSLEYLVEIERETVTSPAADGSEGVPSDGSEEDTTASESEEEKSTRRNTKGTKVFQCETCEATFDKRNDLYQHNKTHGKSRFPCKLCDRVFTRKAYLKDHEYNHQGAPKFMCNECPATFRYRANLYRHVQGIHKGVKRFVCQVCKKAFVQKTGLQAHLLTHIPRRSFVCQQPQCSKKFNTADQLNRHLEGIHKLTPQEDAGPTKKADETECDICDKVLSCSVALYTHKLSHSKPEILCSVCGRQFTTNILLKCHMKSHSDERPYQCPSCPAKFKCTQGLKDHSTVHTKVKSFQCDVCQRWFRTRAQMSNHKFLHTGLKPFKCVICSYSSARNGNLKLHMKVHEGRKSEGADQEEAT